MPFILRGVTRAGINSVTASRELQRAGQRLTSDLRNNLHEEMTTDIPLE
jgi:acrylyl-CoA reductase (NADPH)